MRNLNYLGIPSIQNQTPEQAVDILHTFCFQAAQILVEMNKEIEELKDEVEQLRARR